MQNVSVLGSGGMCAGIYLGGLPPSAPGCGEPLSWAWGVDADSGRLGMLRVAEGGEVTPAEFWRLWRWTMKRAQIEQWPSVGKLEKWILSTLGESTEKSDVHPLKPAEKERT